MISGSLWISFTVSLIREYTLGFTIISLIGFLKLICTFPEYVSWLLLLSVVISIWFHFRFHNNLCCYTTGCLGYSINSLHPSRCLLSVLWSKASSIKMEETITIRVRPSVGATLSITDDHHFKCKRSLSLWSYISSSCLYFPVKRYHDIYMVNPPHCTLGYYHNNAHFHLL